MFGWKQSKSICSDDWSYANISPLLYLANITQTRQHWIPKNSTSSRSMLLRSTVTPIKPRVFEAVGSLGGLIRPPIFYSFLTHPVDLKLCMTIVHSKMQKTDQFFFRKVTWYLDDVIICSFCLKFLIFDCMNSWKGSETQFFLQYGCRQAL